MPGGGERFYLTRHVIAFSLCLAVIWPSAGLASEQNAAREWLYKMGQAVSRLNYQGRFVYINEDHRETMEILHRFDRGGERKRLVSLDGSAREIVVDNDQVRGLASGVNVTQVLGHAMMSLLPLALVNPDDALLRHYDLSMLEADRVAGRECVVVAVKALDEHRYGYQLSIDRETGLLLRSQLLDGRGSTIEELLYTSIELKDTIHDEMLEPGKSAGDYIWFEPNVRARAEPIDSSWSLLWLPEGFSVSQHVKSVFPGTGVPVEHRMYSDGLASFSVYIEPVTAAGDFLEGAGQAGAMHAYGIRHGGYQITVVGDMPANSIAQVARGVRMEKRP